MSEGLTLKKFEEASEIVNKVKDMLTSTDSLSSRMIYLKDSFKIE